MYNWKTELWEAKEKMESALPSIEFSVACTLLGENEFAILDAAQVHLQESISLISRLF